MNIHQVVIVPGLGHSNDSGDFDPGRTAGRVSEVDVIDGYLASLLEELETEDIRWHLVDTRRRPGVRYDERHKEIEPNSLVVHLLAGWSEKLIKTGKNCSQVYYGHDASYQLADELAESIGQWGHCYAHGHKTANPRKVSHPLLEVPETRAVTIEPFSLNGPDVESYVMRLDQLGVVIARCISEHLKSRSQAIRVSRVRV